MNRDKQIEEMARVYDNARLKARDTLGSMNEGEGKWYSKAFYNAGYRKASDVAREIDTLRNSVSDALKLLGIERKKVKKLQKQLAPFREKQCFTCSHYGTGFDHMPCYSCRDYDKYEWLGDAELKKKYESEGEV